MKLPLLTLALLVFATTGVGADASLVHARRAQALLGTEVWSQVVRIENRARSSAYPRTLHALVFELAGILWFYSDVDGTQSFSLHRGRLAEEKADFAPLLRDIEPGFARWAVLEGDAFGAEDETLAGELPNGCFIESYAALRRLVARGEAVAAPRLLSYYAESRVRRQGHTVLAYGVTGRVAVIDPNRPEHALSFPATLGEDPTRLAQAVAGPHVVSAREVPLAVPALPGVFAATAVGRSSYLMR